MSTRNIAQKRDILLAEDSPADVRLMQEIIKECCLDCNLHVVEDGSRVSDYVKVMKSITDFLFNTVKLPPG